MHFQRLGVAALGVAALLGGAVDAGVAQAPVATRASAARGIDPRNFDRSVRPQDDFYRYVNGGWLRTNEIPADRSRYGTFDQLAERSETALRELLEEAAAAPARPAGSDDQKLGDLYLSFMDSARVERLGLEPVRRQLRQIETLSGAAELPELFADLDRLGVQTPISLAVAQDRKQADRYVVYLGQSGLGLPDRDYYLLPGERYETVRADYRRYLETLLRLAGDADPAAGAEAVLALENELARRHWERARTRDRELTYNPRTPAQLDAATPAFSWSDFLDAADAERTPTVIVGQPDYLEALDGIVAATPLATWQRYLTFKLLDQYSPYLSTPFVEARFAFRGRTLGGLQAERPRWKRGVALVEGALGELAGRRYVERHFRPEAKARMQQLVTNLVAAFRQGIEGLEWMSPETKAQAQAKLARFNVKIGYPDVWTDYSALEIERDDLVGNLLRANAFEHDREVARLGGPIDRNEWAMTPQTVNAYYSSSMNEIVFPAAILQPPFFDPAADDAVNYGAIGAVIGHEISHGFDDQGRRSNGEGNLQDWWTEADNAAFQARANLLVEQYGALSPLPGLSVNGRLTLGENIGDLSGLAVAYDAYRLSLGGREAPVTDGLTGDQRFFIGWAQIWRSRMREEALRQRVLTDPHSPDEYRVNAVLRNLPEFHAAWGVRPGDAMWLEPEKRVSIW